MPFSLQLYKLAQWVSKMRVGMFEGTIFLTTGLHSPTTRICSASSSMGCFWWGLFLRTPVTSTAQPNVSNLKRRGKKERVSMSTLHTWGWMVKDYLQGIKLKLLRIIQLWSGDNLQRLQRAPIIYVEKEIFLLRSNRANPSLKQRMKLQLG